MKSKFLQRCFPPFFVTFTALSSGQASATDIVWGTNLGAGPWVWNDGANWTGGTAPVVSTDRGDLRKDWTAAATINLNAATLTNGVLFDDTGTGTDVGVTIGNGGTAGNTLTLAGTTPAIQASGSTLTTTAVIAGSTAWTKSGAGTLVLNNSANSITGAITVSAGVLQIRDGSTNTPAFLTAGALAGSPITVKTSAILDLPRLHASGNQNITWSLPSTTLEGGSTLRFRASTGSDTHSLGAAIASSGSTTIDNNGGGYSNNINLTGVISGTGTINYLASSGSGSSTTTRTLTTSNGGTTFSGNWFVDYTGSTSDDFVALQSNTAASLGTGTVTLDDRARLINNVNAGIDSLSGVTLQKSTSFLDLSNRTWTNTSAALTTNAGTVTLGSGANAGSASIGNLSGTGGSIVTAGTAASTLTVNQTTNGTFGGTIAPVSGSSLAFTKNGAAKLTLSGAAPISGDVSLALNNGTLGIGNGATTFATATTTSLNQAGGNLELDLNDISSDLLALSGNYTYGSGNIVVKIATLPSLGTPYTLVTYGGTLSANPVISFDGLAGTRIVGTPSYGSGSNSEISVTFSGAPANLVWSGATDNTWEVGGVTNNWLNGGSPDAYLNFDNVTFNDSPAGTNLSPVLSVSITPGAVTFNNSVKNYDLSGAGGIAGTCKITKSGTGTTTISTTNTHSGGTDVLAGTLNVGSGGTTGSLGTGAILVDGNLTFNRSDTVTLANTIDGSGTLTQGGSGTLALTGTQSALCNLVGNSGTLQIGDGNSNTAGASVSGAVGITVNSGATLDLPRNHALTVQTVNWSLPPLTLNSGSELQFRGTTGSNIHQVSAPIAVSGPVTIDSNGVSYAQDISLSGVISGSGGINCIATSASGSATTTRTLTVSNAANTYTGDWSVNYSASTTDDFIALLPTASGALGTGTVSLGSRAQLLGNDAGVLDSLTGITLQQATSTAVLSNGWTNATGVLTVNNGTVQIGTAGSYGTVSIQSVIQNGGTIELDIGSTPAAADVLSVSGDADFFSGQIRMKPTSNPVGQTYDVATYGGILLAPPLVTVDAGRLVANVDNGSGVNDKVTVNFTGNAATLVWKGNDGTNPNNWDNNVTANWDNAGTPDKFLTFDHVVFNDTAASFAPAIIGSLNAGSVTFNNSANAYVVSGTGAIDGPGTLTKSGANTATLSTANTFTGNVTVNGGKLLLGNAAALGASTAGTKTVTVNAGGQLDFNNQSPTARTYSFQLAGTGDGTGALVNTTGGGVASNAGVLNVELLDHATIGGSQRFDIGYANGTGGTITGNGKTLTKVGTNDIGFRGDASGSPIDIVVNAGRIWAENTDFAFGDTTGTLTVNNGGSVGTYATRSIATPVTLNTGGALHNQGGTSAVGTWTGAINVAGDANINPAGQTISIDGVMSGTGGITVNANGGSANLNAANTFSGGLSAGPTGATATTVNLGASSTLGVIAGKQVRVGNNAASGTGNQTLNANGAVTNAGSLYIGRPGILNLNSGATWAQSGDMSINGHGGYAADMNVLAGASFTYSGANTIKLEPASANAANATLDVSGTFTTSKGFERTVATSTGNGTVTLLGGTLKLSANVPAITTGSVLFALGAGGGTIDTNGFNGTIAAAISGGEALTKTGAGTLIIDGNNTYSGATNVQNGTLGGKGAAASIVSVASGASIAPGASVGTFVCAGATFASGSNLAVEINSSTDTADKLTASGAVNITGASVSFTEIGSGTIPAGTKLTILDYTGTTLTGTFTGHAEGATVTVGANSFTLSYVDANKVTLTTLPGAGYSSWAAANGAGAQTMDQDHDNDGVSNGIEYFLGGSSNTTGFTAMPAIVNTAGTLSITWTKSGDYAGVYGTDFVVQTSATLASGSWTNEATPAPVAISGNNVTYTFPAGPSKKFARLKVTGP